MPGISHCAEGQMFKVNSSYQMILSQNKWKTKWTRRQQMVTLLLDDSWEDSWEGKSLILWTGYKILPSCNSNQPHIIESSPIFYSSLINPMRQKNCRSKGSTEELHSKWKWTERTKGNRLAVVHWSEFRRTSEFLCLVWISPNPQRKKPPGHLVHILGRGRTGKCDT